MKKLKIFQNRYNSIEIISLDKEPLTYQLIEELYIGGLERLENEIQITDELNILRKERPENEIQMAD